MKSFEELKATFTQELRELEQLAGIWPSTIEKRHVKEQEIGRPHVEPSSERGTMLTSQLLCKLSVF